MSRNTTLSTEDGTRKRLDNNIVHTISIPFENLKANRLYLDKFLFSPAVISLVFVKWRAD
jgi:hypothetical protein